MEFAADDEVYKMPFFGQKVTSGYLKKATQSIGIMLKKSWQTKFCILDLG